MEEIIIITFYSSLEKIKRLCCSFDTLTDSNIIGEIGLFYKINLVGL